MIRSHIARRPARSRTSPTGRGDSPAATAAGRSCWPWRRASARRPLPSRPATDGSVPRSGRATPRPSFISRSKSSSFLVVSLMTSSRSSSEGASGESCTSASAVLRRQIGIVLLQIEHGIFLDLLLDPLLQGQDRQLQNLHRLDHPRRQNICLLLRHPHVLTERKSHVRLTFVILLKCLPSGKGVCQHFLVSKF